MWGPRLQGPGSLSLMQELLGGSPHSWSLPSSAEATAGPGHDSGKASLSLWGGPPHTWGEPQHTHGEAQRTHGEAQRTVTSSHHASDVGSRLQMHQQAQLPRLTVRSCRPLTKP